MGCVCPTLTRQKTLFLTPRHSQPLRDLFHSSFQFEVLTTIVCLTSNPSSFPSNPTTAIWSTPTSLLILLSSLLTFLPKFCLSSLFSLSLSFFSYFTPEDLLTKKGGKMAPFISLSVLFILLQYPLQSLSTNSEGNALHALRSRLSDPNNVLQSWDPTLVNPCTWFHVTCDSNNHVIRLDLGNSNVSGTMGPELGQLHHLQYLELYGNDLRGKIPEELGNLKALISLDLYSNKFEGKIPKSFGKLKSLKFMRLNNNELTGSIPRELTRLANLKIFDVSNNDLCGTIPVDGNFGSFPMESFENNRLSGPELKGLVPYDFGC